MSGYDHARISEAHRGALEARLELLRRQPELRESKLPAALRAAFGETDCDKLQSEADHLFGFAREAYDAGDPESGASYALLATEALDRYHQCLLFDSLAPKDEFLDH